jgi:uncharacterized membrane protein
MLSTIGLYQVVLTIHILAVVVAFGVIFAYPLIDAQIRRAGPAALPGLHRLHLALARSVITPAMVVVLLAGLYLVADGPYAMKDPWVGATFAILVVLFGLAGAVLIPTDRRLAELAERDLAAGGGGPSADYERELRRAGAFGGLVVLLVVVAIFLMTAKPG